MHILIMAHIRLTVGTHIAGLAKCKRLITIEPLADAVKKKGQPYLIAPTSESSSRYRNSGDTYLYYHQSKTAMRVVMGECKRHAT